MTSKLLNPDLYRRLHNCWGSVRVSDHGERMDISVGQPRRDRVVRSWGEGYHVCCPFCRDRDFRLWISHRWGQLDDRYDDDLLWAASCRARGCLGDWARREELFRIVYPAGRPHESSVIYVERYVPPKRPRQNRRPRTPTPELAAYLHDADERFAAIVEPTEIPDGNG